MPKHFDHTRVCAAALAAAAALSVSTPVVASTALRARTDARVIATTLPVDDDHREEHAAHYSPVPLIASSQSLRAAGSANASAVAGYGLLGVVVNNGVNNALFPAAGGLSQANGDSQAEASFEDVLTINAPGLTGQRGTLLVPWTTAAIGAHSALAGAQPSMNSTAVATWQMPFRWSRWPIRPPP